MLIVPDLALYRLTVPTPFPVGPVNLYLITEPETVLIDTGPMLEGSLERLAGLFEECGTSLDHLRKIVLTHSHQDHCGMAVSLVERSGATVYASRAEADHFSNHPCLADFYRAMMVEAGTPSKLVERMRVDFQAIRAAGRSVDHFQPIEEIDGLAAGRGSFRVLPTPGHTAGSTSLWEAERRILLAADTVIQNITPNPFTAPDPSNSTGRFRSLGRYLETLAHIRTLDPVVIYGGHGAPVEDFPAYHDWALELHARRQAAIRACLRLRPHTPHEVAGCLFPETAAFGSFLALTEVFSHLDLLQESGQVRREMRGAVAIYSLARAKSPSRKEDARADEPRP